MIRFLLMGDGFAASKVASAIVSIPGATLVAVARTISPTRNHEVALPGGCRVEAVPADFLRTSSGLSWARDLGADWLLCINSTVILPPSVIELFNGQALNCHPGLLPEYAGLHTHQWAIRDGACEFGATVHRMEASVDAGPIVASTRFPIRDDDTGLSLFRRTLSAGSDLLALLVARIAAGEQLQFTPQDLGKRRIFRHRDALDGRIDWRWPARQVVDFIRAGNYEPFESPTYVAYLEMPSGPIIEVLRAEMSGPAGGAPGALIRWQGGTPVIACGDGAALRITRARTGGRPIGAAEWEHWLGGASRAEEARGLIRE